MPSVFFLLPFSVKLFLRVVVIYHTAPPPLSLSLPLFYSLADDVVQAMCKRRTHMMQAGKKKKRRINKTEETC